MAAIILPHKWRRQPQIPVEVDKNNPISRMLCSTYVLNANTVRNLSGPGLLTVNSLSGGIQAGEFGVGLKITQNGSFNSYGSVITDTTTLATSTTGRVIGILATNGLPLMGGNETGRLVKWSNGGVGLDSATRHLRYYSSSLTRYSAASAPAKTTGYNIISVGGQYISANNYEYQGAVNGVSAELGTGSLVGPGTLPLLNVGQDGGGYITTTIMAVFEWARWVPIEEQLIWQENPWQIFKPIKPKLISIPREEHKAIAIRTSKTREKQQPRVPTKVDESHWAAKDLIAYVYPLTTNAFFDANRDRVTSAIIDSPQELESSQKIDYIGPVGYVRPGSGGTPEKVSFTANTATAVTSMFIGGYGGPNRSSTANATGLTSFEPSTAVVYFDLRTLGWVSPSEWYYGVRYRYGATTVDVAETTARADGDRAVLMARYFPSNRVTVMRNGVDIIDIIPAGAVTNPVVNAIIQLHSVGRYVGTVAYWSRGLSDDESRDITQNPWQLLKPTKSTFYSLPSKVISSYSAVRVPR